MNKQMHMSVPCRLHTVSTGVAAVLIAALALVPSMATNLMAQSNPVGPVTGQYPGGHVGLRGGASPPPGTKDLAVFVRFQNTYAFKDNDGNTIQDENRGYFANIWALVWATKVEFLGGNLGMLLAVPLSDSVQRPNTYSSGQKSGFGLSDVVVLPLLLTYKLEEFDFQWGAGLIAPTGHFDPDQPSRGAGFWEVLGSVGGVWYPGGDRRAWSVSAVARLEFNGTQKDTDIDVGNDIVVDWGVGKVFLVKSKTQAIDVGVSGFGEWQVSDQSGPDPEDAQPRYRVFAIGPEIAWAIPKHKVSFLARPQFQFGARNTTQANNFWFNVSYHF